MKKQILALAMAAALPMGAQAGVTIYGKIHTSIDFISPDTGDSYSDVTSRASRIGFKGSEDLGNGLKLVWKAETTYNTAEGGWGSGRNTYIGLAGGWGTFVYGRHDTPMKMSTGSLDYFSDELADYNETAGFVDVRASDAIAYISPTIAGGLTLAGAIVPDGDYDYSQFDPNNDGGDFIGAYSLAAMYSNGGLFLAGAYEDLSDLNHGDDWDHWRVGAGFDIGAFGIAGVYESGTGIYVADEDYDSYQISGKFAFGNNVVKAMYANFDQDTWNDADSWAVGLDHNFSKRTKMYAQYADSDAGLNSTNAIGEQDGFSVGMVHNF